MAEPATVFELRLTRRHTVILLVSVVDRRILPAIRFVSRLGSSDSRALHVSVDPEETRRLAVDWMKLGLSWLPLHVREATADTLPASVRDAVRDEAPRQEPSPSSCRSSTRRAGGTRFSTGAAPAASPPNYSPFRV